MQVGFPINFRSQNIRELERIYSIFDKDILAILHVLAKFMEYLVGGIFGVKKKHNSLGYFLEQKDLNERQKNSEL